MEAMVALRGQCCIAMLSAIPSLYAISTVNEVLMALLLYVLKRIPFSIIFPRAVLTKWSPTLVFSNCIYDFSA